MKTYVGTLTGEDLIRYRQVYTKRAAVGDNPTAYSQNETEAAIQAHWKFFAELHRTLDLAEDDLRILNIEPITGQMYLNDAPD